MNVFLDTLQVILIKILTYLPYIGLAIYVVRVLILKIAPARVPKGKKLTNDLLLSCVNQLKKQDKNNHSDYVVSQAILDRLREESLQNEKLSAAGNGNRIKIKYNEDTLKLLLNDISGHVGLNGSLFVLRVKGTAVSDRAGEIRPGVNNINITLDLKEEYDIDTIISILAHEVMHQYLFFHGISRKDAWENEILTDTAVLYTGFYEYMKKGYAPKHGINPFAYSKVGYISVKDIEFIKDNINGGK